MSQEKYRFIVEFADIATLGAGFDALSNYGFRIIYTYKHLPFIVVEATIEEVEILKRIFGVRAVWPDEKAELHQVMPLNLDSVLTQTRAPETWDLGYTGRNTYICIVDTGICGTMPEFPSWKRALGFAPDGSNPWTDEIGHGTMCAAIAAATKSEGGRYDGVAPDAFLISGKTNLYYYDIIAIYDWLIDKKLNELPLSPIVVSNSWGIKYDPTLCGVDPNRCSGALITTIRSAVNNGIVVVFSAGNSGLCAGEAVRVLGSGYCCNENSIWVQNSLDEVLSVGALTADLKKQPYSSVGPGDCAVNHPKPDVSAPVYGEALWGCGYRNFGPSGWGTSGACPQVAGLAALILSRDSTLSVEQVCNIVRYSANPLEWLEWNKYIGYGLIDCYKAVSEMTDIVPPPEIEWHVDAQESRFIRLIPNEGRVGFWGWKVSAPRKAVPGDSVEFGAYMSNAGGKDDCFFKLIDRDTDSVVVEHRKVLPTGMGYILGFYRTVPNKNWRLRAVVGHVEG